MSSIGLAYAYDAAGALASETAAGHHDHAHERTYGGVTTSYAYDGNGGLLRRSTAGPGGSVSTVYVGETYEVDVETGRATKRYEAAGHTVAVRTAGVCLPVRLRCRYAPVTPERRERWILTSNDDRPAGSAAGAS